MNKEHDERVEILIRNTINLIKKINMILEALEIEQVDVLRSNNPESDEVVEFDKSVYEQMCFLMETNAIPFMGIA